MQTSSKNIDVNPTAPLLIGLIGRGIQKSRTPLMHMKEAERQGVACTYRLLDMDEPELSGVSLPDLLGQLESEGYVGVNVTFPYKIEVIDHLDALSDNARAVGAVNTVVFKDGKRFGHNTDLWGFQQGFQQEFASARKDHALLLGAGGAGVAVAHALADCGIARLSLFDADPARAEALAAQLRRNRPEMITDIATDLAALTAQNALDGVVNATPMGMAKLPGSAFPTALLQQKMWVADIVYFPLETELLKAAEQAGCQTMKGSGMAVYQAVRAFELFTGHAADLQQMQNTFNSFDT